jgi:hypothetical protein
MGKFGTFLAQPWWYRKDNKLIISVEIKVHNSILASISHMDKPLSVRAGPFKTRIVGVVENVAHDVDESTGGCSANRRRINGAAWGKSSQAARLTRRLVLEGNIAGRLRGV